MTTSEFREEFKILYDNISSNAAPGLDDYEMSVYLTTAQLELVKRAYSGSVGSKGTYSATNGKKGFEGNERRRRELSNLVRLSSVIPSPLGAGLKPYSLQATLPPLLYIVHERAKLSSTNPCIDGTYAEVIPTTYDEYALVDENPFRKDSNRRVLRLDFRNGLDTVVELICPYTITAYDIRFIAIPTPIILSDLTVIDSSLSINGHTAMATSELNEGMHREILKRAVDLAIRDYRENTLSNKIQTQSGFDYKED